MRYVIVGVAAVIAGSLALFALAGRDTPVHSTTEPPVPVDFSGRWKLTDQETKARGGKSALGNHEEPVTIAQSGDRLSIKVESPDPAGAFEYDTTGRGVESTPPGGKAMVMTSRWEGRTLVTKGERLFTSPSGAKVHRFEERRRLSADVTRMTVETRIDLFLEDVYRTSVYARIQ
jgi:hypothetical protein